MRRNHNYTPPLGNAQKEVLRLMTDNGGEWRYTSPWVFRSKAHTIRVLESLVKRDLVAVVERFHPRLDGIIDGYSVYVLISNVWENTNNG